MVRVSRTDTGFATQLINGPGRDRTSALRIMSPLLYQLSYRPAGERNAEGGGDSGGEGEGLARLEDAGLGGGRKLVHAGTELGRRVGQ